MLLTGAYAAAIAHTFGYLFGTTAANAAPTRAVYQLDSKANGSSDLQNDLG